MKEFEEFKIKEYVEYDGKQWYRYPNSNNDQQRNYFACCTNGKNQWLHRYKYKKEIGPIPEGLCVDHIDENPLNNNINNLQLLTRGENSRKSNIGAKSIWFGKKHSKKSIEKMSIAQSGVNHWNYGGKISEEHKQKISLKTSGENNPMYGKKHNEESKFKISQGQIKHNLNYDEIFNYRINLKMNYSQMSKLLNCGKSTICRFCIKNNIK